MYFLFHITLFCLEGLVCFKSLFCQGILTFQHKCLFCLFGLNRKTDFVFLFLSQLENHWQFVLILHLWDYMEPQNLLHSLVVGWVWHSCCVFLWSKKVRFNILKVLNSSCGLEVGSLLLMSSSWTLLDQIMCHSCWQAVYLWGGSVFRLRLLRNCLKCKIIRLQR